MNEVTMTSKERHSIITTKSSNILLELTFFGLVSQVSSTLISNFLINLFST